MGRLVLAVMISCWGTLISVWVLAGVSERSRRTIRGERSAPARASIAVGAVVISSAMVGAVVASGASESSIGDLEGWVQVGGAILLVASTLFALWARLTLGSAWSIGPRIPADRALRSTGPYGVTRHPIYTGILGMISGSALVVAVPVALLWTIAAVVGIELKIHQEERLLTEAFPDEYPHYRERVPQLIPGLRGRG